MNNAHINITTSSTDSPWPKVSVITVVRNDREGLSKTISSVANQEYPYLEYVVVDGESTDGSLDVIHNNESFITYWTSEPDNGLYDAMNKGKAAASGDYILFLNAGDTFPAEDALRRLLTPFPDPNMIVFGNVVLSHGDLQWHRPFRKNGMADVFDGYLPHHQTILYPRSFFQENDYDLTFHVVADADYTKRAVTFLPCEHRDVDIVASTLGGFTFTMYQSLNGARRMYRERLAFSRRHNKSFSRSQAAFLGLLVLGKYLCVRVGGVTLATRIMYWKLKMGVGSFR